MKGKRVFVTGASGFLGGRLVKRLQELGAEVSVFIHKKQVPFSALRFNGDLREPSTLSSFLQGFNPEYVFHLAAQPLVTKAMEDEVETLGTNIVGTYNLYNACKGLPSLKTIVHVSTDKVYGEWDTAVSEKTRLHGVKHPYNVSKLSSDLIAQMYFHSFDLPIVISRSGNIYGGGDMNFDRLVPETIIRVLHGEKPFIRSNGKMVRDYIYVDDIVDAYLLLAELGKDWHGKAFNFGAKEPLPVLSVVDEILKSTGRIDLSPEIVNKTKLEIPYQHIDWSLAKSLGWSPKVDLEEGISKTVAWYRGYVNGN